MMNEETTLQQKETVPKESKVKSAVGKIKNIKHIEIIIAAVAVIIMLLIYFTSIGSNEKSKAPAETTKNYCERMQSELEALIAGMDGAGKAKVLINWDSSVELVLAEIINNSTSSSSTQPVIIQNSGNSSPIVVKEIYPKAVGVLIICQGGNDAKLKVNIIMAVATLLDISPEKIIVYAMSK